MIQKLYYANARFNGKTALLAGPFLNPNEAEAALDHVQKWAEKDDRFAQYASFGVIQLNAPGQGEGRYNEKLPQELRLRLAVRAQLN